MYITELFKNKENITYTYTKRNTDIPCPPDLVKEETYALVYDSENGNLFCGKPIAFKGSNLLGRSVDITVNMKKRYFVDHVTLSQSEGSKIGSIDVFAKENGALKIIATLSRGEFLEDKDITISVGYFCDVVVIRLNCAYLNMGLDALEVHAAAELENTVYPIPNEIKLTGGILPFNKIKSVTAETPEALSAAEYLCEKLNQKYGLSLSSKDDGEIVLSIDERDDDGYSAKVTDSGCRISAGKKCAFFYGADTLVQLCTEGGIKCATVSDSPMMELRGMHFALPSRSELPFLRKVIRDILVPMRYNIVFIQIAGIMRYDNFPEINDMWLTACEKYEAGEWPKPAHYGFLGRDILEKEEIAELLDYIRSFGIEIVPEVQCLSHSQYISTPYPFLAELEKKENEEDDLFADDAKPTDFYHHNLCPSHPEYYNYVLGIADEVIELFRPERFIHFGHDEVYLMGKCEKCAAKGAPDVFAEEVTRLNDYAKSKGLRMMIWGDMLQNRKHAVPSAIDKVPKDIILLDFVWYFFLDKDIEDKLLDAGFQVMLGNMYSSHFTRFNSRSKKNGIIGAEVSTWVGCDEHTYAYEGKMYDLVYSANTMWSADYDTDYRLTYNEIIKPVLWDIRKSIGNINDGGKVKALDIGGSERALPLELLWGTPYDKALALFPEGKDAEIKVGDYADLVMITHATDLAADRVMWLPAERVGEYELVYSDGTSETFPALYGDNIYKFSQRYGAPFASPLFRHEGYTGTYSSHPICGKDNFGADYTLLEYPIVNPHPEKKIEKIVARHMKNTDAWILIFDAKIIKNN